MGGISAVFILFGGGCVATSWLRPLHVNKGKTIAQTISDRISYAMNPDKTQGGMFVVGYACDPRTVDEEFLLSKREYEYITGRDQGDKNILAYHLRQSFKPGEITPQQAQEVSYELAMRWTRGKHAFIVAIHTDREHIHSAIIYNSTTLDCTGKFNNFKDSSLALRRLSDLICAERGFSIIDNPKPSKGRNYGEWLGDAKPLCWKEKLRNKIDEVLPECDTFESFLSALKADGYKVRDNRKHVSVCAPGQGRPWRLDSLGEQYTEEAIRERLGKVRVVSDGGAGGGQIRVNLLIDIQAKIREGKGPGYEHWARIFNIKQAAKTLLFLKENQIDSYDDLVKKTAAASSDYDARLDKVKDIEKRMTEISELQKHIGTYGKTRDVFSKYKASKWNAGFYEEHRADIVLHRAAKKHFDGLGLKKLPSISSLKQEYAKLAAEKKKLYFDYYKARDSMRALLTARGNADRILGIDKNAPKHGDSRTEKRSDTLEM